MADKIKRMDMNEFVHSGFLQEANRLFFHGVGLALEVQTDDGRVTGFGGVWDYRDDPEGMMFGSDNLKNPEAIKKMEHVRDLRESKMDVRIGSGECDAHGVQEIHTVKKFSELTVGDTFKFDNKILIKQGESGIARAASSKDLYDLDIGAEVELICTD